MRHRASEFARVDEGIDCLLNINNFLVISAWKNHSIEAPTYQTYFLQDLVPQHQLL